MNATERDFLVADMARRVLLEHAAGRSVDPQRLDWALDIAIAYDAAKRQPTTRQKEANHV